MMEFLKILSKIRRGKQRQELGYRVTEMKSFIAIYSEKHQVTIQ